MAGKHSEDEIPKAFQKNNDNNNVKTKKKGKTKKNGKKKMNPFLKVIIVLAIILVLILGVLFGYITSKLNKIQQVDLSDEDLGISENENLKGYRNIAIFGVDSRSDDYGVGNRSDSIIIASINNETGDIKLISVYRDTYVNIEGYGLDKITHAYSYGEAPLAIKTLNTNLDLNIEEFVTVNFDSVSDAVDALGGIQMKITDEEVKYINKYIRETASVTGKTANEITSAGTYTLDGVQAVAYSRIRYTSGGDYKRTERMRDVIEAMFKQLKTKSVTEINTFANTILPEVYSNIGTTDILALVPNLAKYSIGESIGWPYETKGITLDRWYGVPVTLESNVLQLHQEVFGDTDYTVPESIQSISQSIINKTGYTN